MPKILRKYRVFTYLILSLFFSLNGNAQTTSGAAYNWSNISTWTPNAIPTGIGTVTVNSPLTLDQDLVISSGNYTFNKDVTDQPGGTNYNFNAVNASGSLTIASGTTIIEGITDIGGNAVFTLTVKSGATLILGTFGSTLDNFLIGNKVNINIELGGTIIVYGNIINSNSSGIFSVNGLLQVFGDYKTNNGNIDINGTTGQFYTTGSMITQGASSEIYGSSNDCLSNCSGTSLSCGASGFSYTATILPQSQTICANGSVSSLTFSTNSPSPTYQWESSLTAGGVYAPISGATLNSFTPSGLTVTTWFRVKYTSTSSGCGTRYSAPIPVYVSASTYTQSTAGQTVCGGVFSPISVSSYGSSITYQWYSNDVQSNSGGVLIVGATSNVYTPPSTIGGTKFYYCKINSPCGANFTTAASGAFVVNLNGVSAASSNPTLCISTSLPSITHTTTGATGIGVATGLPAGVNASWASNTITISGTPTASGTFSYSIPLTGGCGAVNATGIITVTANNTVGAASSTPTLCISTSLTSITHTTTAATGIGAATGLPAGVNAAWTSNTITISGTPTASGTFNYSIPLTGGCGAGNATGTITVTPLNTVAAGVNRTTCINSAITNITLATTGATGASVTGLPAGVTGSWLANVVSISGTPTASGTFNYTVTTTGGCIPATTTGTITVTPLNTVAAGTSQTVCISSAITNITLATTGATGATVTGLPAGVTGNWAANVVTISGTPTASGTFNYTVTTTGGCIPAATTGTISVTTNNTVGAASSTPTICISTSLTSITHTTTGATGIGVATGLPAGVNASWASNAITISGTPTASGTFSYSIPLTGGCGAVNATGTITVTANNTVGAASSTPTLCISTSLTSITHTTTGATGIGVATGLPAGVNASWASNTITISGTPTASGTFNYSIPLTGGCGAVNATGTINVEALSIGGSVGGGTTICSGSTSALLTLTGYTGTIIKWQSSVSPFSTWTDIVNTGATYTSGVLTTTTQFRAVVQSGSCLPSNSSVTTVTINPLPNNITNGFSATIMCAGGSPQLTFDADDTTFTIPYSITYKNNAAATLYTVSIPSAAPYSFTPGDNPTANADYTLISISNATCTTTSGFLDSGANLIVRPMPTATISASAGSACVGASSPSITFGNPQTVALTVNYTINSVAQTVNIVASGSSTILVPTTTFGTFVYSLVSASYQSTAFCANPISGSATVTINPNLAASLSIAPSPTGAICSSTAVTFTATPVNGGTTPSYQWKLNGGNVGFNSATYTNASWTNGDVVTCVMSSNASPCLTGSPVTSNGITMAVNPNLPASVSIAPLPVGAICAGTSVTFTATPTNGGTSPTYQWYNGTTLISGATGATYTSTSLANGDAINVVMTSNATCATASPATSNTVTMTVPSPAIWNGSWTNGPPTNAQALIFNGSYNSIGDMEACSCQVNSGFVKINSGHMLKITNGVTVSGGSLTFEDTASLVQINNAINSGNIKYKRTSSIILDTDYVYWSSPVAGYTLGQVSPDTPAGRMYSYDAFATPEDWQLESAGTVMAAGKGYIIRGPDYPPPLPPFPSGFPATFVGVPNNGVITTPIGGVNTSNLIGNPYPSALDADAFLAANSAVLEGTIYFWTHNTAIQVATNIAAGSAGSGTYAYTSDDYASYNGTGSVAASAAGFNGSITPSGKIGAGQSFFATSIAAGQVATFTNDMRLDISGAKLDNSQFFKNASNSKAVALTEKNRIWLNLTNAQGAFKQTLVGYISGATNEIDHAFDGESFDGNEFIDFYSINNDKNLTIQGRALPFDELDEVPLGYRSAVDADYTISLDHVDGIFMDKAVYLKDNKNNKILNLKESSYTFKTGTGTFNDRFVLLFYNTAPQVVNPNKFGNEILISNKDKQIKINSSDDIIESVVIYDLLGRQIYKKSNISAKELLVLNLPITKQAVLLKIKLKEGKTINKTIIY